MTDRKKKAGYLIGVLLILVISALAVWFVTSEDGLRETLEDIREADGRWLAAGAGLLVLFVALESVQMNMLLKGMGYRMGYGKTLAVSNIGFFFSQITPGATGGQPMQVVYLAALGVNALVGSLVVMLITIIYKLVLLLLFAFFMLVRHEAVFSAIADVKVFFSYGLTVQVGFLFFLILCVFRPLVVSRILNTLITAGKKLHIIAEEDKWRKRIEESLTKYEEASFFLRAHPVVLLRMLLLTLCQRLAYFSITWCVAKALGVQNCSWLGITSIQVVLSLAVDLIPIPGTAGVNEYVFMDLQDKMFGSDLVKAGVLLNRGITFFLLLVITGLVTFGATLWLRLANKEGKE